MKALWRWLVATIVLVFSRGRRRPQVPRRERIVPPGGSNPIQGPHAPAGAVMVNVNMTGFDPAEIAAKAGQPLKLAFFRPNAANCGREVVFPDLGIRKELPPGQTVVVDITPPKSGWLGFECGMKMLKGQLIVR